jgi:hypothetical protein
MDRAGNRTLNSRNGNNWYGAVLLAAALQRELIKLNAMEATT